MSTPPESPGHSPPASPDSPPLPPRNPARTLPPIATQRPDDDGRHLSPPILTSLPFRTRANTASMHSLDDNGTQSSPSPGIIPPPPPPPSRNRPSRGSIPISPGGSEYPPAIVASHPVHYPGLHSALDDLSRDSGTAGLPSPESSRSPGRPRSARSSFAANQAAELAHAYRVLQAHYPPDGGSSSIWKSHGRDIDDDYRLSPPNRQQDGQQAGQLDGASTHPELSQVKNMMARTSLSTSERTQGMHPSVNPQSPVADIQPTTSEMTIMRSAAETAQLARPEPIRPGLAPTVMPTTMTTQNTTPIAATTSATTSATTGTTAATADVHPAPRGPAAGQSSYPTFSPSRASLPGGLPIERLDSTAGAETLESAQGESEKKRSGSPLDGKRGGEADGLRGDGRKGSGA
ncbi:hypothetical protein LTR36_006083 [Oleoguttula mirabilis]|uniref:Uncharacterized protein n=1 Tax=Oleoguttula mirabilis TaxID=1507867 RepID=A0AAV9JCN2_9PEZI|nr:hypothetical protein LTR36_006083 [Oleoguttula mirabilis]